MPRGRLGIISDLECLLSQFESWCRIGLESFAIGTTERVTAALAQEFLLPSSRQEQRRQSSGCFEANVEEEN